MNKKLVAAALGLAFAAPVFADSSNVTLYGRIHQAIDHQSSSTNPGRDVGGNIAIEDASSRLGVRGVEDLGGGLSAIFAYEFGVDTDTVSAAPLTTRHAYLGFKGGLGTIVIGSQDGGNDSQAPLYNQAGLIGSPSNQGGPLTTVGGGSNLVAGAAGNAILGTNTAITRLQRTPNSIGYAHKIAGVQINARHALLGDNDAPNNTATVEKENGSRSTEVAATYNVGALTVGGGFALYDQQGQDPIGGTDAKNTVQGVASYNFGGFTLAGLVAQTKLYGNAPVVNDDSNTEFALSAIVPLAANSGVIGTYADSERNNLGAAAADVEQVMVAYYYDFSKRTRSYVGFNRLTTENKIGARVETEQDNFTIGLRHNF